MEVPALHARVAYILPNGQARPAEVLAVNPTDGTLTLSVTKHSPHDFSLPPQAVSPSIILGHDATSPITVVESVEAGNTPGKWYTPGQAQAQRLQSASTPASPAKA